MRPAGSVAVVTGGASGIGRALCLALAAQDAAGVVVADLDGAGAAQVAAEIEAGGHRALAVTADMSSAADVEALVEQAESTFGRIDLFCSNAGIIARGGIEVPDDGLGALLGGQRPGPRLRGPRRAARHAGARRRLPDDHRVRGRPADRARTPPRTR